MASLYIHDSLQLEIEIHRQPSLPQTDCGNTPCLREQSPAIAPSTVRVALNKGRTAAARAMTVPARSLTAISDPCFYARSYEDGARQEFLWRHCADTFAIQARRLLTSRSNNRNCRI